MERLPQILSLRARQTTRLQQTLQRLGFALGGEAGARLSQQLHMPISPDTLLRLVRQNPVTLPDVTRILGVDDFALRKGRSYGTLLCDLERHRPIGVLPDRSADTFAVWLSAHPGVEIISRDRATAYADGAARGAPQAMQVADRFHLLKNLGDAVEGILQRYRPFLQRTERPTTGENANLPGIPHPPALDTASACRAEATRLERRAQRQAHYRQVVALREHGLDIATIATQVGLSRRTVMRFLGHATFPERKPRTSAPGRLAPYLPYLHQRWQAGCHNATHLWCEICEQGYTHSRSLVHSYVAGLKRGEPPTPPSSSSREVPERLARHRYTPREAKWLFLQRPVRLDEDEKQALNLLQRRCPDLARTYSLTQAFTEMMQARQAASLEAWLAAAQESAIPELRRFASGIEADKAAVSAGLSLPWSQGQVEGQVNRLKLLKRQMYGRAKLDLLGQRVLHQG